MNDEQLRELGRRAGTLDRVAVQELLEALERRDGVEPLSVKFARLLGTIRQREVAEQKRAPEVDDYSRLNARVWAWRHAVELVEEVLQGDEGAHRTPPLVIDARDAAFVKIPKQVAACPEDGHELELEILAWFECECCGLWLPDEGCHSDCVLADADEELHEVNNHTYLHPDWSKVQDRALAWAQRNVRVIDR